MMEQLTGGSGVLFKVIDVYYISVTLINLHLAKSAA